MKPFGSLREAECLCRHFKCFQFLDINHYHFLPAAINLIHYQANEKFIEISRHNVVNSLPMNLIMTHFAGSE
jgi:hypothetical protein